MEEGTKSKTRQDIEELCKKCQKFFSNPNQNNLCSVCYKEENINNEKEKIEEK